MSESNATKIEFDVNLTCNNCASAVKNRLSSIAGIDSIHIDVQKQSVIVETSLPSQSIKEAIESTGKKAILKGFGSNILGAAVAELKGECGLLGVIRFHQSQKDLCVIDGTIDGLTSGEHGLHIHEFGDLSEGCQNIGLHFNPDGKNHGAQDAEDRHYGDLGNITADASGRASFRIEDPVVKIHDIIGRALSVKSQKDDLGKTDGTSSKVDGNAGTSVACAIIARSAGLFGNPKRLCACDGVGIWDELKTKPASSL